MTEIEPVLVTEFVPTPTQFVESGSSVASSAKPVADAGQEMVTLPLAAETVSMTGDTNRGVMSSWPFT